MSKILFVDTETTGLDCTKHGIIQIAMIMDIDGENKGELLVDVQPFEQDILDYEIDGKSKHIAFGDTIYTPLADQIIVKPSMIPLSQIMDFEFPGDAHNTIAEFLDLLIDKFDKTDKAYLAGYNVNFDRGFLSEFFRKCGDNYLGSYLNWKCLDPLYLLWQMDYEGKIALENYKLENVCNHFGIELYAHNAMSDIKATRELWYRLVDVVPPTNGGTEHGE